MIQVSGKRHGKYAARVRKGRRTYYINTSSPEEKDLVFYVAYMLDKGLPRLGIYDPNKGELVVITLAEDRSVTVSRQEAPPNKTVEEIKEYVTSLGEVIPIFSEDPGVLKKYKPQAVSPVLVIALVLALIFSGGTVLFVLLQEEKKPPPAPAVQYMTPKEKEKALHSLSFKALEAIEVLFEELPQKWKLERISYRIRFEPPAPPARPKEEARGELEVVFSSLYPVKGSRAQGDVFVFTKSFIFKPENTERKTSDYVSCALDLLELGWNLEEYDSMSMSLSTNDFAVLKASLERLSTCTFSFTSLNLLPSSYNLGVRLHVEK